MTKDIPEEVESQADIHDEDIHRVSSDTASGHSRQDSNITNSGVSDHGVVTHGVVTRSKRKFLANLAHGKFQDKSKWSSHGISHSHRVTAGEMGSSSCFLMPLLCMGVYGILATLVIAVLSFFLQQCSGRSSGIMTAGDSGAGCVELGPEYSTTNLDFLNVDVSSKKIMDSAESVKCDCNWETILEWGIFEVVTIILLVCIFCWLCLGDGMTQCRIFLKKRNSDENRLKIEYDLAVKNQEKLALKMGKAGPDSTAHASVVEEKPQFSAV